ncbi:sodium:alanine symporter family protein [Shewanella sp. SNU WT4]|uniref:alanine/glycine:cation symporter family protein n=1 Tax=Shewanella sp. SNU WT4 TaxID=2590015 RepID=UPI00112C343C|nr:sodium:alanine symporter family protein [Shewanella sp. SNU WT4]QDF65940.1 sodium:alanine symporter family protein [Shewanella sp. SNU WT4]
MESITQIISTINSWVWGPPMLVLILGVGFFLSLGLKLMPVLKIGYGFKLMWSGRTAESDDAVKGEISPYNALMTSLSATIGTGNIAGVATAIFMGGPGALFWMWCTAMVGMATKYSEAVLAVKYREVDDQGNHVGGPMYYIKNGLGKKWAWLGTLFAIFGALAGFGIGNTVQANSVAEALATSFNVPAWASGTTMMVLVGLVLMGGVKRLADISGKLVPLMTVFYVGAGLGVLFIYADQIPAALVLVIESAFNPVAAQGGFAGAAVWAAIHFGVARGVFSNEAGLGSAAIAHAAAKTKDPVAQGLVAMLGTFIDTIIVCSITGLAIIVTGAWTSGANGAALTSHAFSQALPMGNYIVAISLTVFAFTTILGWSLYSEKCAQYLFGTRVITPFRWLWTLAVPLGAISSLDFIWLLADTLNALMAIPNLIALILLSPVIFGLSREYFKRRKEALAKQSLN